MKEIIRTLKPYIPEEPATAVKERLGVDRLVRLSANENPYGTSPLVREAILSYVTHNDANYYPDGNATDLRMKLAAYWKVQPEQLVIGVGLDEVIAIVNKTLISAGGVLLFGIPEFRLSKSVVRREIARLEGLGVKFVCNTFIGQDKTLDELFAEGFDSIFIGTGTHIPQEVRMENDEVHGVFQAMYLLTNVQLVDNGELDAEQIPVKKGDRVIIIGGGNVAMDAARTCVRLGCESVTVAYRRSQEQMPALLSEYEEARAEGVQFQWFASPVGVEGTDKVEGFKYEVMALNDDGAGIHGTGKYQVMPVDKIIIAAGHKPNARLVGEGNNLRVDEKGYIITSEEPYGMTSREGVFAGGDVVHKPATVVLAMREAKKAVDGMVKYMEIKKAQESANQ